MRPASEAGVRLVAGLPLSYLGAAGCAAAATTLLVVAGVDRLQAAVLPMYLSYLVWLSLGLYAVGASSLWRACGVPGVLGIVGFAITFAIEAGGAW